MARKLFDAEEAAKMLGVSLDKLNEMRERKEVFPVKDGGGWKYKEDDLQRVLADRGDEADSPETSEFAEFDEGFDSILINEQLGQSGPGTSSTVIGKNNEVSSSESDIQIASPNREGSGINLDFGNSDVKLAGGSGVLPGGGSDVITGGSSNKLKTGSDKGAGLSSKFDELDTLDLDLPSPSESGIQLGSDFLKPNSSTKMNVPAPAADDDDELLLMDDSASATAGADDDFDVAGSSSIELASASDDDLVLGGSGVGSDVTLGAADSGISLVDPADSGLSLDQAPLELGGSAVESLELGEDEMIVLEEDGDSETATQLKADDDFLLTPLDEGGGEESDSGSQVIALDSDMDFDESAATMLGARGDLGMAPMLEDDAGDFGEGALSAAPVAPAAGFAPAPQFAGAMVQAEAPFALWNVLALLFTVMFLLLSGMMMYDMVRNMWSWNSPYPVKSPIMDAILELNWF